ncbi:MAG: glycosyltransferase [candidate division Zixibacteria bacterium]|nr:glycosyltransferase [candidate division Zixibacteria bacterium]MBU1470748.1 glycosyltransferase [candidate division Zixibacteria bacterium]MBU2624492.1 glycosyltransferase [candidate division Zixibacteria bacterium]
MTGLRTERKSVLVLTHNFPRFSGDVSGVFLRHLLLSLTDSFDFTVVAPHDKGLPDIEEMDGITVRRFRYASDDRENIAYRGEMHTRVKSNPIGVLRFLRSYSKAARGDVAGSPFDAIWAHWWIPGGWAGLKSKGVLDVPLVVTCHGTDIFLLNKFSWLKPLAKKIFSAADRITVVSNFLKNQLVGIMESSVDGVEQKISVAPMPVDDEVFFFDPELQAVHGSILSASRLTAQKHLDKLIRAGARLRDDGIEFDMAVYGDGPERQKLLQLIQDLDLSDHVRIHNPVPQAELAGIYRKSEIAALVSEHEGFGLMLQEAMLCGCAGVGADSGGITDMIAEDGRDGILVQPRDADALYSALKSLLTDRERLSKLRESGRRSAEKRFSGAELTEIFRTILNA